MGRVIPIEDASMLAMFAYQIQARDPEALYERVVARIADPQLKLVAGVLRDEALGKDLSSYDAVLVSEARYYQDWARKTAEGARKLGQERNARRRASLRDLV